MYYDSDAGEKPASYNYLKELIMQQAQGVSDEPDVDYATFVAQAAAEMSYNLRFCDDRYPLSKEMLRQKHKNEELSLF